MGRFQVVEAPAMQPGVDYVTGTAQGPFIDTGRDITVGERRFGRIYLSKDTVREMAQEFGLLGPDTTQASRTASYHEGKLDGLREELGGDLYRVVNTLERWLDRERAHLASASSAEDHG